MKSRSRRYTSASDSLEMEKTFEINDAISCLSKVDRTKFDESIELSFSLGVDPKQSSQSVRGTVNLPHGSGKEVKVLFEKPGRLKDQMGGKSEYLHAVHVIGKSIQKGDIKRVKIINSEKNSLGGILIEI